MVGSTEAIKREIDMSDRIGRLAFRFVLPVFVALGVWGFIEHAVHEDESSLDDQLFTAGYIGILGSLGIWLLTVWHRNRQKQLRS